MFLSSALNGGPNVPAGIRDERERIYLHGQQYGDRAVWVDEHCEPGRGPDPFAAIDDFLLELERSKLYLALVATDWPGSRIDIGGERANVTFFETELFYAAALGRPIAIVIRNDIAVPPETTQLLRLLQRVLPRVAWRSVSSAHDAEDEAKRLIDEAASGRMPMLRRGRGDFGRLLHRWWSWREPDLSSPGLRWLDGRFLPCQQPPNQTVVEECLRLTENAESEGQRLSRLWIAARELMGMPYTATTDEHWLILWNKFLSSWNSAAAWYGLHGHLELGYLGALHSLVDVREVGRRLIPKAAADPEWENPYASLGSAYYAAAHRVASRRYRRMGLEKALAFVDRALPSDPIARSNVLAIRGSVLQKLHAYLESADTYRKVLELRQASGASEGSIGEAMTELGFGLLYTLRWRRARDLLREGVALMERANYRAGFVIRGKRKYAAALFLTANVWAARDQLAEAGALAERSGVGRTTRK